MNPTEPSLDELKEIEKELYKAPSTDENMKKIRAIGFQIKRIKKLTNKE